MIADYRAGRTPNPDVRCNRLIKFDSLWRFATARGAEMLATGHYAKIARQDSDFVKRDSDFPAPGQRGEVARKSLSRLLVSTDREKDQTYFLWTLTQADLAHTLFPVGNYCKREVRELAKRFRLANADKPDSQGLCFVGPLDFKSFLRTYLPVAVGPVRDETGETIGEHDGTHFYTIGERHGFRVTAKTATTSPLYVIAKDAATNTLTISPRPLASAGARSEIILGSTNWVSGVAPSIGQTLKARIRHRAPLVACQVGILGDCRARVFFFKPIFGAAPGQSCVFYDVAEAVCLGGGVIAEE